MIRIVFFVTHTPDYHVHADGALKAARRRQDLACRGRAGGNIAEETNGPVLYQPAARRSVLGKSAPLNRSGSSWCLASA